MSKMAMTIDYDDGGNSGDWWWIGAAVSQDENPLLRRWWWGDDHRRQRRRETTERGSTPTPLSPTLAPWGNWDQMVVVVVLIPVDYLREMKMITVLLLGIVWSLIRGLVWFHACPPSLGWFHACHGEPRMTKEYFQPQGYFSEQIMTYEYFFSHKSPHNTLKTPTRGHSPQVRLAILTSQQPEWPIFGPLPLPQIVHMGGSLKPSGTIVSSQSLASRAKVELEWLSTLL